MMKRVTLTEEQHEFLDEFAGRHPEFSSQFHLKQMLSAGERAGGGKLSMSISERACAEIEWALLDYEKKAAEDKSLVEDLRDVATAFKRAPDDDRILIVKIPAYDRELAIERLAECGARDHVLGKVGRLIAVLPAGDVGVRLRADVATRASKAFGSRPEHRRRRIGRYFTKQIRVGDYLTAEEAT